MAVPDNPQGSCADLRWSPQWARTLACCQSAAAWLSWASWHSTWPAQVPKPRGGANTLRSAKKHTRQPGMRGTSRNIYILFGGLLGKPKNQECEEPPLQVITCLSFFSRAPRMPSLYGETPKDKKHNPRVLGDPTS